jgi:hypothetical protein
MGDLLVRFTRSIAKAAIYFKFEISGLKEIAVRPIAPPPT